MLLRLFATFALVLLGSGCSPFPKQGPTPSPQSYLLQWSDQAAVPHAGGTACGSIGVSPPRPAPGFGSVHMAYSETPYRVDYYAYHQWADTPAQMVEPLLVRALEQSGRFRAVVKQEVGADADLWLASDDLRLLQRFEDDRSAVELDLRVVLLDASARHVLAQRRFEIREPAEATTPYAGVRAANRAMERLLEQLTGFIEQAAPPCSVRGRGRRENPHST